MNVLQCQNKEHRHWRDPATEARRCIECEEAWLDRMDRWQREYRQRKREQRREVA